MGTLVLVSDIGKTYPLRWRENQWKKKAVRTLDSTCEGHAQAWNNSRNKGKQTDAAWVLAGFLGPPQHIAQHTPTAPC